MMRERKDKVSEKKNRLFFSFFKKHKSLSICLIAALLMLGSFLVINYSRYVKEIVQVYYLRTKDFYFNSDKLTIVGKTYEINPWGGTTSYDIPVGMNSLLNSIKGASSNILYTVSCTADSRVDCYIDTPGTTSMDRTLNSESHVDNFNVTVKPKTGVTLADGDRIRVDIRAEATSPYSEVLEATFYLVVGNYGLNYEIEDVPGRIYFDCIITNTLDTTTAKVKLSISDISKVSIDMDNNILSAQTTTTTTTTYNGYNYIDTITFNIAPKSSWMVRYYKSNPNLNYSFNGTGTPIVGFQRIS